MTEDQNPNENNTDNINDAADVIYEKAEDLKAKVKEAYTIAKIKATEFSAEAGEKTEVYSDIAKEKVTEFAGEASEKLEEMANEVKEKIAEFTLEAGEKLEDLAKDTKITVSETKSFLQYLFGSK